MFTEPICRPLTHTDRLLLLPSCLWFFRFRSSLVEHLGSQSAPSPYQYPLLTLLSCPNLRSIMTNHKTNCYSSLNPHHRPSSILSPFTPTPSYTPNSSRMQAPAAEQESPLWYILTGGLLSTCQLILLALPHLCQVGVQC